MAGLRAGIREVPRLIQATRKHSDSFRTVSHGSPTLDSFQFKIREAESNKDSNKVKEEESKKADKEVKNDSKEFEKAAIKCRLNSNSDETCPANQVSPLADVAHLLLTCCPSHLTPSTWLPSPPTMPSSPAPLPNLVSCLNTWVSLRRLCRLKLGGSWLASGWWLPSLFQR